MRDMKTPAQIVIETFGIRPLARDLGINKSTIVRWRSKLKGRIPHCYHHHLIALARSQKRRLTMDQLLYGE